MPKFRKKPIEIEALQFTGNWFSVWTNDRPDWLSKAVHGGVLVYEAVGPGSIGVLRVLTSEGTMTASPDDWLIRGVKGELYPCKPDIFAATYEAV